MNEMMSTVTSVLAIHLNVNQSVTINTSAVLFSLEKLSFASVSDRLEEGNIRFPVDLGSANQTVLLRVKSRQ
jgi:hypothetical protein